MWVGFTGIASHEKNENHGLLIYTDYDMHSNSETKTHFRFVSVNEEGMMGFFFLFLNTKQKMLKQ